MVIDAADSAVPDTPVFGCGLDFRFAERRVADRVATGAHHYILEHGRALHRIWLRGDPERAVLAAIIPLDGMTGTRLEAVQELDRSLRGVPTPQPGVWPTLYQAQRLDLLLAILDLREGMGLMQIMPGTWASLTARHRLGSDPFDPRANILAGAAYLRAMWDRYGDIALMLAAYNAGPGRADAYASGRRGLPAETIAYVAKIAPELHGVGTVSAVGAVALPPRPSPGWRGAGLFAGLRADPENARPAYGPEGAAPSSAPSASLFISLTTHGER